MKGPLNGHREYTATFYEIAARMGLTRPGVERIYLRAIKKLKTRGVLREFSAPVVDHYNGATGARPAGSTPRPGPTHTPTPPLDYVDWDNTGTRVVSGPYGTAAFPGRRFPSRSAARAYWTQRAGKILQEWRVPGRYIFRVRREEQ
jgi:hypothetical protein